MRIRKRITIDENVYKTAIEYSKLDNRTFSALMQTAVEQMMHRYPKKQAYYSAAVFLTLRTEIDKIHRDIADLRDAIL